MTRRSPPLPERERLVEILERIPGARIVVLGDAVVDEFVHGEIQRVSREAPVLILEQERIVRVPGGAGNAVANVASLGACSLPVGLVGDDDAGRELLGMLRERGIDSSHLVVRRDGSPTPTKSRIVAGGPHTRRQQIVRVDRGTRAHPPPRDLLRRLRRNLASALQGAQALLISDYGLGSADPALVHDLEARVRPRILTLDSRRRLLGYPAMTACTPNQEELEQALALPPLRTQEGLEEAGRRLLRRTRHEAVLVTQGARGMTLFRRRRPPWSIPAYGDDEVADVTGAGDTVIATFTAALAAGGEYAEAAFLANVAAGLVVRKAGTATVARDELRHALDEALP